MDRVFAGSIPVKLPNSKSISVRQYTNWLSEQTVNLSPFGAIGGSSPSWRTRLFNYGGKQVKLVNAQLEKTQQVIEGAKRQYLPYTLSGDCPVCGKRVARDFANNYLSYPSFGERSEISMYCYECDTESTVAAVPRITLELVE